MNGSNITSASNTCVRPEPTITWYWSVRCLISVASIAGNGVIIFLITTRHRLRNTPNMFILSLAVADFCFGMMNGPVYFPCTIWFPCNQVVMTTLLYIFLNASILNLCALTFDRYLAIVFPLWYQMILTKHRAAALIGASWLFGAFPLIPYYFCLFTDSTEAVFISFATALVLNDLLPVLGMVLAYLHMFKIVRHHISKMKLQRAQLDFNHTLVHRCNVKPQESSSLKVIGAVILVFILCNIIVIYLSLCLLIFPKSCSTPESLVMAGRLLVVTNSAANFVIYAMFKVDIRREVKGLCCCPKRNHLGKLNGRICRGNKVRASTEMTFMALQPFGGQSCSSAATQDVPHQQ